MSPKSSTDIALSEPPMPSIEEVDVLIIGAGPSGLTLANCFNHSNVTYRIVDKKPGLITAGQADSLKIVSMQIFDSFGLPSVLTAGAIRVDEVAFWNSDESSQIRRSDVIPDIVPGLDEVREVSLNQSLVENMLLENLQAHRNMNIELGKVPVGITIDESKMTDHNDYPFEVVLRPTDEKHVSFWQQNRGTNGLWDEKSKNDLKPIKAKPSADGHMNGHMESSTSSHTNGDTTTSINNRNGEIQESVNGQTIGHINHSTNTNDERVRARYIVASDGAHSWTRRYLEVPFRGEHSESLWGVIDVIPKTDFPDIRRNCIIRSAKSGNLMLIPREEKLVRLYVQLQSQISTKEGEPRFDKSRYTQAHILEAANKILSPYRLTYEYCDWWSVYQVGQRLVDDYSIRERLFFVGDAAHTHSPKAGQGMNTGIQDSYNLGWKLLACMQWNLNPRLLSTYGSERRPVAEELLSFDRGYAQSWTKNLWTEDGNAYMSALTEFQKMYMRNMTYTTSILIQYAPSRLIAEVPAETRELASKVIPGMRLPDFQILNQSDAVPSMMHKILVFNGCFRLLVFAGDISFASQANRYEELGRLLCSSDSFLRKFTPCGDPIDSRIEVITVHAARRESVELQDLPVVFHPWSDVGGWDYWKVFVDEKDIHGVHGKGYEKCGIRGNEGCMIVVRPDGYVGLIAGLVDVGVVATYFQGLMG